MPKDTKSFEQLYTNVRKNRLISIIAVAASFLLVIFVIFAFNSMQNENFTNNETSVASSSAASMQSGYSNKDDLETVSSDVEKEIVDFYAFYDGIMRDIVMAGEKPKKSMFRAVVTYQDGSDEDVDDFIVSPSKIKPIKKGESTAFKISYGDYTDEVEITGVEVDKITAKLDDDLLSVAASFSNGEEAWISNDYCKISRPEIKGQTQTFTISLGDKKTTVSRIQQSSPQEILYKSYGHSSGDPKVNYISYCEFVNYKNLIEEPDMLKSQQVWFQGKVSRPIDSINTKLADDAYLVYMTPGLNGKWWDPVIVQLSKYYEHEKIYPNCNYALSGEYDGVVDGTTVGLKGDIPCITIAYADMQLS